MGLALPSPFGSIAIHMSIYTKTGDTGQTSLFGGNRISKANPQVEAYGAVDEATCFIGFARESLDEESMRALLTDIQQNLYKIMGYLAGAKSSLEDLNSHISIFEQEIDHIDSSLPKLTRFILPQGGEPAVRLQIARSMIRSAERRIVAFISQKKEQTETDLLIVRYINRLSDLFFMLARKFSNEEKLT